MPNAVTVWQEPVGAVVPKTAKTAVAIAGVAESLSPRDQKQIVTAYQAESYEMMAGFVLNKALSQLKRQLSSLGMEFVGEMLGRQDLDEDSIPTVSISNFEAISLARELGILNSTDAMRLTQHTELLAHFDNLDPQAAEIEEMSSEEALAFLRTCVNSILGRAGNLAPMEFVNFRNALESQTFKETDVEIGTLKAAPYFFKRTTLSILLANIKTRSGAQLEHTLGNIVVLTPILWPALRDGERWSVGQAYAEAVNAGRSASALALKKGLTAVSGFDYVPENLRSQAFSSAAAKIINVHTEANNFYNEPSAISGLMKLGSTIPWPAFPICMSAVLAVFLGNQYGHTWAAQADVEGMLRRLTKNQWDYYFNESLSGDQLVLQKLTWYEKPRERWIELVATYDLSKRDPKVKDVLSLLNASAKGDKAKIATISGRLLSAVRN